MLTAAYQDPAATVPGADPLPEIGPGQVPAGEVAPGDPREPAQETTPSPEAVAGEAGDIEAGDVPTTTDTDDLIKILMPQKVDFDEGVAAGVPPEVDPYVVDPRQALTIALQNSRSYQFNLETVYLQALPVTFQRFRLAPEFQAGMSPGTPTAGGTIGVSPGNSYIYRTNDAPGGNQSLLSFGGLAGFGKLFSSGLALAGGFANQTVIDLGGPNAVSTTSRSFLPLSVSQAFLKGGGRAVTLENLTQAERTLLYEVRNFAQFRREFMVSVLAGGGITGGSGDPTTGFLQVLSLQQQVENATTNVLAFQRVLEVFQELGVGAGSSVAPLDIINVELQLQTQRNNLVSALNNYRNTLDQYKQQLGMPPDVPVIPDSSLLTGFRQVFERIDALSTKPRGQLETLVEELPALQEIYVDGRVVIGPMGEAAAVARKRRPIQQRVNDRTLIQGRIDRLAEALQEDQGNPALASQVERFRVQLQREQANLATLGSDDATDRQQIKQMLAQEKELLDEQNEKLEDLMLAGQRLALENRLDLMNTRAQLYDTWRQLAVTANALLGVFTVQLSNQFLTPATTNNPFGFNDQAKQFSLQLNAELPLVRVQERNNYITARINYERRRRALMQAEDQIKFTIRQDIRNLQLSYQRYEISKRQYVAALVSQDQSFQRFLEPPRAGGAATSGGGTVVLSLTNSLTNVLGSQNSLVSSWVQYQQQRLGLYRDLAIMPYDEWEAFYELFPSASTSPDTVAGRDAGPAAASEIPPPRRPGA